MNLNELQAQLRAYPDLNLIVNLPDGGRVPAHFHITEIGHVTKKFVDCGGTFRAIEACVLQTFIGSPRDDGHRLTAGKLAHILDLARPILPSDDLPVEVEFEDAVISQFPLTAIAAEGGNLVLQLALKHTDCLAKDKCGIDDDDGCGCGGEAVESERCCVGAAPSARCC